TDLSRLHRLPERPRLGRAGALRRRRGRTQRDGARPGRIPADAGAGCRRDSGSPLRGRAAGGAAPARGRPAAVRLHPGGQVPWAGGGCTEDPVLRECLLRVRAGQDLSRVVGGRQGRDRSAARGQQPRIGGSRSRNRSRMRPRLSPSIAGGTEACGSRSVWCPWSCAITTRQSRSSWTGWGFAWSRTPACRSRTSAGWWCRRRAPSKAGSGGRVFLFLHTDDFWRDYEAYRARGVVFVREPKTEAYGTVAVFRDLYGNLWDLLQPTAGYLARRHAEDIPSKRPQAGAVPRRAAECSCGQLGLVAEGEPLRVSICHCLACQRRSGSAFAVQARFPAQAVAIRGRSHQYVRTGDEGGSCRFHFCLECGTTVYFVPDSIPDVVSVPVGVFADPGFPPPQVS